MIQTIAVAQINAEKTTALNLDIISKFAKIAHENGCKLIVFPELVDLGYRLSEYEDIKESPWNQFCDELQEISSNLNIVLVLGGCEVDSPQEKYNSLFVVQPNGLFKSAYRKRILFGAEANFFSSGSENSLIYLDNCAIGVHICFDLRFPELFFYPTLSPTIQLVAAAWPLSRIVQWKQLLVARAIENQCFVIASNRVGCDDSIHFGGCSLIISPYGEILAEGSENQEMILSKDLDTDIADQFRTSLPVYQFRQAIHTA